MIFSQFSGYDLICMLFFWQDIRRREIVTTLRVQQLLPYDIRVCGSTLYVGIAHPAPSTDTNFQLMFRLTRLLKAIYEDLPV